MDKFEKQFAAESKLYKTVDGVDYYLYNTNEGFFFWTIVNGKRLLTPMYKNPPNGSFNKTPDEIWAGGYEINWPATEFGDVETTIANSVLEDFRLCTICHPPEDE